MARIACSIAGAKKFSETNIPTFQRATLCKLKPSQIEPNNIKNTMRKISPSLLSDNCKKMLANVKKDLESFYSVGKSVK